MSQGEGGGSRNQKNTGTLFQPNSFVPQGAVINQGHVGYHVCVQQHVTGNGPPPLPYQSNDYWHWVTF